MLKLTSTFLVAVFGYGLTPSSRYKDPVALPLASGATMIDQGPCLVCVVVYAAF